MKSTEQQITRDTQAELTVVLGAFSKHGESSLQADPNETPIVKGTKVVAGRVGDISMRALVDWYPNGDQKDTHVRNRIQVERTDRPGVSVNYKTRDTYRSAGIPWTFETSESPNTAPAAPIAEEVEVEDLGWEAAALAPDNTRGQFFELAKTPDVPSEQESQQLLTLLQAGLDKLQSSSS